MERDIESKPVNSLFVSLLYYGINKAIIKVMGTGGMVLGRRTSYEMITLLKNMGYLHENMDNNDVKNLFVNTFGLSEDLIIEETENEIIFNVVKPTLGLFLKKIMEEHIEPYVCPFIHLLSAIYSETKPYNLMLKQVIPEPNNAKLIFKKVPKRG